jgi:fructose/tagatose bisphosphate aldolase
VLGTGARGRYLLAATFGNVHGVYAPGHVELRPGLLNDGQAALASARPGARFAYVFHGGIGHKSDYDPRSWGAKAEAALASHVAGAARLFGTAGRSLLRD